MFGTILSYVRRHHVGLLGLLVAMSGTAYATSASREAANPRLYACVKRIGGSVRLVGARTRCLRSERKVSWNQRGIRGLPGLTGATGSAGPPGTPGAPGQNGARGQNGATRVVTMAPLAKTGTPTAGGTLPCGAGQHVVGGGANVGNNDVLLQSSPDGPGGQPATGWAATARDLNDGQADITIHVLCASP